MAIGFEKSVERKASSMRAVAGAKELVSMRIDVDVLEWFRGGGPGYQTRMNAVLRRAMERGEQDV